MSVCHCVCLLDGPILVNQQFECYLGVQMKILKKARETIKTVDLSQIDTLPKSKKIHLENWRGMDGKVDKAQIMLNNNYINDVKNKVSVLYSSPCSWERTGLKLLKIQRKKQ